MKKLLPVIHNLKCDHKYFIDVVDEKKRFEVRLNDRNYKVGDLLKLHDFCDGVSLQRFVIVEIIYMLDSFVGLKDDFVVLGINLKTSIIQDY